MGSGTRSRVLLLQNRPVTQVAKLLGYKDPTITLTTYAHWFRDAEERNRDAMTTLADAVLNGGSETVAAASA